MYDHSVPLKMLHFRWLSWTRKTFFSYLFSGVAKKFIILIKISPFHLQHEIRHLRAQLRIAQRVILLGPRRLSLPRAQKPSHLQDPRWRIVQHPIPFFLSVAPKKRIPASVQRNWSTNDRKVSPFQVMWCTLRKHARAHTHTHTHTHTHPHTHTHARARARTHAHHTQHSRQTKTSIGHQNTKHTRHKPITQHTHTHNAHTQHTTN